MMPGGNASIAPRCWDDSFSGRPELCSTATGWNGALVRSWRGTAPLMEQPPLDQHYAVLHLGGPKTVRRRTARSVVTSDVQLGAVSLTSAGQACSWNTEGPIEFAHVYLQPGAVDRVVQEDFDRDPRSVALIDQIGQPAQLIAALFRGMLDEIGNPGFAPRLVLDTLLHSLIVRLLCEYSTLPEASRPAPHTLAPRRLRRVLEFIDLNLAGDIALDDLAAVAGSSRYHFSRAFRDATGLPPYRYLVHRRVESAKTLLLEDSLSIGEIAGQCGFKSQAQLSAMFRQVFGTSPARFRREH